MHRSHEVCLHEYLSLDGVSPNAGVWIGSYASRLRTLFWIALSNLVFPVIFDIAQLILIFRDSDFVDGSHVITANSYVAILGVLFSTIWASGSGRMAETTATQSNGRGCTTSYGIIVARPSDSPLVPKTFPIQPTRLASDST